MTNAIEIFDIIETGTIVPRAPKSLSFTQDIKLLIDDGSENGREVTGEVGYNIDPADPDVGIFNTSFEVEYIEVPGIDNLDDTDTADRLRDDFEEWACQEPDEPEYEKEDYVDYWD